MSLTFFCVLYNWGVGNCGYSFSGLCMSTVLRLCPLYWSVEVILSTLWSLCPLFGGLCMSTVLRLCPLYWSVEVILSTLWSLCPLYWSFMSHSMEFMSTVWRVCVHCTEVLYGGYMSTVLRFCIHRAKNGWGGKGQIIAVCLQHYLIWREWAHLWNWYAWCVIS